MTQNTSYPIYDTHGNLLSSISRQGTGNFATSALRTCDAWGQIRIGAQTGDPKGRYCANLGHKQDDESGAVYMRARYYEPSSGRFLCEDPDKSGLNWYSYASQDPVNGVDQTGRFKTPPGLETFLFGFGMALSMDLLLTAAAFSAVGEKTIAISLVGAASTCAALAQAGMAVNGRTKAYLSLFRFMCSGPIVQAITAIAVGLGLGVGADTVAAYAVFANAAYSVALIGALFWCWEGVGDE